MGVCLHGDQITCTNCRPLATGPFGSSFPGLFDVSVSAAKNLARMKELVDRLESELDRLDKPSNKEAGLETAVIARDEKVMVRTDPVITNDGRGIVWFHLNEGDEITIKRADRARAKRPRDAKEF